MRRTRGHMEIELEVVSAEPFAVHALKQELAS
jgi:hypothetical protein